MKKLIVSLTLAGLSVLAWALPTLQQVEAEVGQGNYARAESMMGEVIAAKPGSARAHYVYAEILAHEGKLGQAAAEAKAARTIDPDVKFTDPEKFRTFESKLLRAQSPAPRPAPATSPIETRPPVAPARVAPAQAANATPSWVWLVALAAIGFFLWRMFSRSRAAPMGGGVGAPGTDYSAPMPGAPGAGTPYGPGAMGAPYGAGYAPQRPGSGMLGVGLGAAGGVAAGMLAERMLNSRRDGGVDRTGGAPGLFDSPQDGSAANDLDQRPIDFGTGGSDWDAGAGDGGGGDGGGSGGDGGGGWD